jgi:hypothetical protein
LLICPTVQHTLFSINTPRSCLLWLTVVVFVQRWKTRKEEKTRARSFPVKRVAWRACVVRD